MDWIKDRVWRVFKAVWQHRAVYAVLAAAYGLGCLDMVDKEVVSQIAAGAYAMLATQRH